MKIITLHQPWAMLVCLGIKQFETRSWSTKHRGPLLIHASKRKDQVEGRHLWHWLIDQGELDENAPAWDALPQGAIIGEVFLENVLKAQDVFPKVSDAERMCGNFNRGRFAWFLTKARRVAPFPVRGYQRLWNWDTPLTLGLCAK